MAFDLNGLVRPNILKLKPYSSARSEFAGEAEVFLDANENAFGSPAGDSYNRYPDPLQKELKRIIAEMNSVTAEQIFVGKETERSVAMTIGTTPNTRNTVSATTRTHSSVGYGPVMR